jgi:type II secretory pathway pseudopilin PulG
MKKEEEKREKGFTLIEVMVVLAIMMTTGSLLFLQFFNARNITDVEVSARNTLNLLSEAQTYGRGGRAFTTNPNPETDINRFDKGYGVFFQKNSNTIFLYGGEGVDSSVPNDNKYISANLSRTLRLQDSLIQKIEIDETGSGSYSETDEIHILFRRGEVGALLFNEDDDPFVSAEVTLQSGDFTKKIIVWNTGLFFSE